MKKHGDIAYELGVVQCVRSVEEAEEHTWAEISQYLHSMSPYDFQELITDLLRAMST